jgi:hypothetical protein
MSERCRRAHQRRHVQKGWSARAPRPESANCTSMICVVNEPSTGFTFTVGSVAHSSHITNERVVDDQRV